VRLESGDCGEHGTKHDGSSLDVSAEGTIFEITEPVLAPPSPTPMERRGRRPATADRRQ
jgi:hypothetical protein